MEIIVRKEAIERGLPRYFTGKPCKHGHVAERRTAHGVCIECRKIAANKYIKNNPDKVNRWAKNRYHGPNGDKIRKRLKMAARKKRNNPLFVKAQKERQRDYHERNPHKRREATIRYRNKLKKHKPAWANDNKISEIYKEARKLGVHVDHVIPLRGKKVCGLHVETNLQLLLPKKNLSKGAKYETT